VVLADELDAGGVVAEGVEEAGGVVVCANAADSIRPLIAVAVVRVLSIFKLQR